ncbi:SH3 domain-containing protein [Kordia algicida OT-1]|uniref:SH3b domain-containing protein n=1 Tax=Kordia algicida OT-1 TaxID=391587 RepID=A9DIK5_9FLAO|nr:SH3 domain-containing protein [Kordia algicida]EDP97922.1 hypothetical protein KAOT1_11932 [Kordia algicida OT-1]
MKTSYVKTLFFLFIFCATVLHAQSIEYLALDQEFKIGNTYPLFGDNVNLRAAPNTSSKEMTRLRIGFNVTILAKTDIIFENGNHKMPWYKVQYNNLKGYIPGQFIASKSIKKEAQSFYFRKHTSKKNREELLIRMVTGTSYHAYSESSMQLYGASVAAFIEDNHQLYNVQHILRIQHYGDSCGAENGNTYFFINDVNELVFVAHLSVSGDALYSESETFTFTTNPANEQPSILFTKEVSDTVDEVTGWTESKSMSRYYEWNGTKLVPEFSKEFYKRKTAN